jgi:hypothetical protein
MLACKHDDRGGSMSKLKLNITTSIDGFVARPDQSPEHPLGVGGEKLHSWFYPLEAFRGSHGEQGGTTFHFVTDGIESALEQARAAAGGSQPRGAALDRLADVAFERFDRSWILDHVPAQALAAATADVRVGEDGGERPSRAVLAHDVRAQACFAVRPPSKKEIGIAGKPSPSAP